MDAQPQPDPADEFTACAELAGGYVTHAETDRIDSLSKDQRIEAAKVYAILALAHAVEGLRRDNG